MKKLLLPLRNVAKNKRNEIFFNFYKISQAKNFSGVSL